MCEITLFFLLMRNICFSTDDQDEYTKYDHSPKSLFEQSTVEHQVIEKTKQSEVIISNSKKDMFIQPGDTSHRNTKSSQNRPSKEL